MPRTRPLTRCDPREAEIKQRIALAQIQAGQSYRQICKGCGLPYSSFMRHKQNVKEMRLSELWQFEDQCKREAQL